MCNANMVRNQLSMSSSDDGGGSSQAWDANTDWLDLNFIDWVRLSIFLLFQCFCQANKEQPYWDSIISDIS